MKPGNLEGGFWGTYKGILVPPEPPLKIPRFPCPALARSISWIFIHCHIPEEEVADGQHSCFGDSPEVQLEGKEIKIGPTPTR